MTVKERARLFLLEDRRWRTPIQRELFGQSVAARVLALPEVAVADTIALYVSSQEEVPTDALLNRLAEEPGRTVLLPAWVGSRWDFVVWRREDGLRPAKYGIPAPSGPAWVPGGKSAVAIVPVVGWGRSGLRVGRGGGHYDRLLGCLRSAVRLWVIGIAYEFQRVLGLSMDEWDEPLDMVVTERRVVRRQTLRRADSGAAEIATGDRCDWEA